MDKNSDLANFANIKVVGVGGSGGSAVTRMINSKFIYQVAGKGQEVEDNIKKQVDARVRIVNNAINARFTFTIGRSHYHVTAGIKDPFDARNNSETALGCHDAAVFVFFSGFQKMDYEGRKFTTEQDLVPGDWPYIANANNTALPFQRDFRWALGLEGENLICIGIDNYWAVTGPLWKMPWQKWIDLVNGWKGTNVVGRADPTLVPVYYPTVGLKPKEEK